MTLTPAQLRALLYLSIDGLGYAGTGTFDTDGVTDAFHLANSDGGIGDRAGRQIARPSLSGNDRIKIAGDLDPDTGELLHTSSIPYSDTGAGKAYEYVGLITFDELQEVIRLAQQLIYFPTHVPHSIWEDGDFSAADASSWSDNGVDVASSKVATAAAYYSGFRSLRFGGTGSGYTVSQNVAVTPGKRVFHAAIASVVASGSGTYSLWDATNNVQIGATWTFSGAAWQRFARVDTIPATCRAINVRLGTTAGAIVYWDSLPSHLMSARRLRMPDWLVEPWMLYSLREARYDSLVTTDQWEADSKRYEDWRRPSDYDTENLTPEAGGNTLQINRDAGLPANDLWYHGMRPWADRYAMSTETDATEAPEALELPACKFVLSALLMQRYPDEDEWVTMHTENNAILMAQRAARKPTMPRREKRMVTPGGRW